METKVYVEYMAYLDNLMKREENIGKDEKELVRLKNLNTKLYSIVKCGDLYRRKLNLPLGTYFVRPLLKLKTQYISDLTSDEVETIAVLVSKEELQELTVPYSSIYELEYLNNSNYKRRNENIYLMPKLSMEELCSIENEETLAYYNKFSQGLIYSLDEDETGKYSLTRIYSKEKLENINQFYICNEEYPQELKGAIKYLKAIKNETFELQETPNSKVRKRKLF